MVVVYKVLLLNPIRRKRFNPVLAGFIGLCFVAGLVVIFVSSDIIKKIIDKKRIRRNVLKKNNLFKVANNRMF